MIFFCDRDTAQYRVSFLWGLDDSFSMPKSIISEILHRQNDSKNYYDSIMFWSSIENLRISLFIYIVYLYNVVFVFLIFPE